MYETNMRRKRRSLFKIKSCDLKRLGLFDGTVKHYLSSLKVYDIKRMR